MEKREQSNVRALTHTSIKRQASRLSANYPPALVITRDGTHLPLLVFTVGLVHLGIQYQEQCASDIRKHFNLNGLPTRAGPPKFLVLAHGIFLVAIPAANAANLALPLSDVVHHAEVHSHGHNVPFRPQTQLGQPISLAWTQVQAWRIKIAAT